MKDLDNHKLDELFRKQLEQPEIPYEEEDWLAMQQKLGKEDKRRYFITGISTGAAAAIALLLVGWWLLQPSVTQEIKDKPQIAQSPATTSPAATETAGGQPHDNGAVSETGGSPAHLLTNDARADDAVNVAPRLNGENGSVRHSRGERAGVTDALAENSQTPPVMMPATASSDTPAETGPAFSPLNAAIGSVGINDNNVPGVSLTPSTEVGVPIEKFVDPAVNFRRSLVLSFAAGRDYNGVSTLNHSKAGSSLGFGVALNVTKRFSVATGATLAHKVYSAAGSYYKPDVPVKYPSSIENIDGACRVLDVPLDVRYAVLTKRNDRIALSAGVSSYFMLKEDYQINYNSSYPKPPYHYSLSNQNRHILSIANLGIIYQRKISPLASVSVQPYVKLPFKDIGYGNVKLLSGGAAVSLNVELPKLRHSKTATPER